MPQNEFYTITAMVCYHCRRAAVVRLVHRGSFASGAPKGDLLQIFFVSCAVCLALPSVYNPVTAVFPNYIDPRAYSDIVGFLTFQYKCAPSVPQQRKFSLTSLRIKSLSRIRDPTEIFDIETIPAKYITVWKESRPATINSRFFKHEPLGMNRWPDLQEERGFSPYDSVLSRLSMSVWPREVTVPLCPRCLSDTPPAYTFEDAPEKPMLEIIGMYPVISFVIKAD